MLDISILVSTFVEGTGWLIQCILRLGSKNNEFILPGWLHKFKNQSCPSISLSCPPRPVLVTGDDDAQPIKNTMRQKSRGTLCHFCCSFCCCRLLYRCRRRAPLSPPSIRLGVRLSVENAFFWRPHSSHQRRPPLPTARQKERRA